jgi:hypothetical protein
MRRGLSLIFVASLTLAHAFAQDETTTSTVETSTTAATAAPASLPTATPQRRSWMGRMLHPFSGGAPAPVQFHDPKLRGLVLDLQVTPQTVKLSEVRQLQIKLTVTNKGKRVVTLDFPNDQRIDIYLMNSAETVLTKWSETHAVKEKPGTLLINPQEQVEYNETISTRELTPDKVYIAEAFFPKYPELRARQKFLTAP